MADLAGERHLRYLSRQDRPDPHDGPAQRRGEARVGRRGLGIIVLPLSATRFYTRPDIVYVPVTDAEPDEVLLAHRGLLPLTAGGRVHRPRPAPSVRPSAQYGVRLASPEYRGSPRVKEG